MMLRSAKIWQQADQKQLDEEIHSMLNDKNYVPKVLFETPRSLKEATGATTSTTEGPWLPEVAEAVSEKTDSSQNVLPNTVLVAPPAAPAVPVAPDSELETTTPPELSSLDQIEAQIQKAKDDLAEASSYGGGFDVSGRAVAKRKSKRPSSIDLEIWQSYNEKQKSDAETELGSKRNKIRQRISELETQATELRGNIALSVCAHIPDRSIVIQDLNGFVAALRSDRSRAAALSACSKSSIDIEPHADCQAFGGVSTNAVVSSACKASLGCSTSHVHSSVNHTCPDNLNGNPSVTRTSLAAPFGQNSNQIHLTHDDQSSCNSVSLEAEGITFFKPRVCDADQWAGLEPRLIKRACATPGGKRPGVVQRPLPTGKAFESRSSSSSSGTNLKGLDLNLRNLKGIKGQHSVLEFSPIANEGSCLADIARSSEGSCQLRSSIEGSRPLQSSVGGSRPDHVEQSSRENAVADAEGHLDYKTFKKPCLKHANLEGFKGLIGSSVSNLAVAVASSSEQASQGLISTGCLGSGGCPLVSCIEEAIQNFSPFDPSNSDDPFISNLFALAAGQRPLETEIERREPDSVKAGTRLNISSKSHNSTLSNITSAIFSSLKSNSPARQLFSACENLASIIDKVDKGNDEPTSLEESIHGHQAPDKSGLVASDVEDCSDDIGTKGQSTILEKFIQANSNIKALEQRKASLREIKYVDKPSSPNESDSFFQGKVDGGPELKVLSDLELSAGSPPESLSESQKLARALRPEPASPSERTARTENGSGKPHSKGQASERTARTSSGSSGLAGSLPPPSLGAAGRSSSPSDLSKVAFIEFCCGPRSYLCQDAEGRNLKYLRFTKESHDMTSKRGVEKAIHDIKALQSEGYTIKLWASVPCRPWTLYTDLNAHRLGPRFKKWLISLRLESYLILQSFVDVAELVLKGNGDVSFEWPAFCHGWKIPLLQNFFEHWNFQDVRADGCAFGLQHKGRPIKKPWLIKTTHSPLVDQLKGFTCTCKVEHVPCAGSLTPATEKYTPKMAHEILTGLMTTPPLNGLCASSDAPLDLSYACDSSPLLSGDAQALAAAAQAEGEHEQHRPKHFYSPFQFLGLVTKTIPPKDPTFHSPEGKLAIQKEVGDLRAQTVWDESTVAEWGTVKNQRHNGYPPMVGLLFIIMGLKNAELAGTSQAELAILKARAVFQGSNIRTGDGTPAHLLYQEVGATPSNLATAHCAIGAGALKGSRATTRDVKQAYIQSEIDLPGRPRTWIRLPKYLWPKSWFNADGSPKYVDPVCILKKSLYGHPESGAIWDKKLHKIMKGLGYDTVEGCPGFFYHAQLNVEVTVYVDDFILIAPPKLEAQIWAELEKHMTFKDPPEILGRYLGIYHHIKTLADGTQEMTTEAKDYVLDAAQTLMEEAK
ncbi:MAG: reverse transcriptase domain-containing protein, partial [Planctomycetota bacterium]